jgi:hypothetical protein
LSLMFAPDFSRNINCIKPWSQGMKRESTVEMRPPVS